MSMIFVEEILRIIDRNNKNLINIHSTNSRIGYDVLSASGGITGKPTHLEDLWSSVERIISDSENNFSKTIFILHGACTREKIHMGVETFSPIDLKGGSLRAPVNWNTTGLLGSKFAREKFVTLVMESVWVGVALYPCERPSESRIERTFLGRTLFWTCNLLPVTSCFPVIYGVTSLLKHK